MQFIPDISCSTSYLQTKYPMLLKMHAIIMLASVVERLKTEACFIDKSPSILKIESE